MHITFTKPGGQPTSFNNSIINIVAPGSFSDGFITIEFPAINAIGNIHKGIIAGKLNGHIPAVTPKGNLYDMTSISLAIFGRDSPCNNVPAAQLCSTTSKKKQINKRVHTS